MSLRQDDPAELTGDALRRWYLRSPEEIEDARQTAADARYTAFFEGSPSAEAPVGAAVAEEPSQDRSN